MREFEMKAVLVFCFLSLSACQLIIPKRKLGYVYNGANSDALIHLDVHLGPLCPDSGVTFPVVKQVAEHYGKDNLKLTVHMFPLPYHQQAFLTAIGAHVVEKFGNGNVTVYDWFETIYSHLDVLSNAATANMTTHDVISLLSNFASSLGIPTNDFLTGMQSRELDRMTRAAWKYSCTRSVASTPTFFLNDIPIAADQTWTWIDWKRVIDPLL